MKVETLRRIIPILLPAIDNSLCMTFFMLFHYHLQQKDVRTEAFLL